MKGDAEQPERDEIKGLMGYLERRLDWLISKEVNPSLATRLDRETIVQETLRKGMEASVDPAGLTEFPRSWYNTTLYRTMIDEVRRMEGRGGSRPDHVPADSKVRGVHTTPYTRAAKNERDRRLHAAMEEKLTEDEKLVLSLCVLEDPPLTYAESAVRMGKTIDAVASLLKRAKRKLREHLEA